MNVGENIRKIRKAKGLTMKDLGKNIGISEQGIGNYERGDRKPDFVILDAIATELECKLFDLLGVEAPDNIPKKNPGSYFLEQYIHTLGYEIIGDAAEGYLSLKSRDGEYEITMNDITDLKVSSKSFIEYKLHEIIKKSREIGHK